jgi:hypothetical protein
MYLLILFVLIVIGNGSHSGQNVSGQEFQGGTTSGTDVRYSFRLTKGFQSGYGVTASHNRNGTVLGEGFNGVHEATGSFVKRRDFENTGWSVDDYLGRLGETVGNYLFCPSSVRFGSAKSTTRSLVKAV